MVFWIKCKPERILSVVLHIIIVVVRVRDKVTSDNKRLLKLTHRGLQDVKSIFDSAENGGGQHLT